MKTKPTEKITKPIDSGFSQLNMADFFESYGGLLISLLVLGAVEAASRSGEAGC